MRERGRVERDAGRRRRGGAGLAAIARPVAGMVAAQPAGSAGVLLAAGFTVAIAANALFLQAGPHPAPLVAPVMPAQAPKETGAVPAADAGSERAKARTELLTAIQRELASRGYYDGAIDGIYGPRMEAAIREFEQAAGLPVKGEATDALLRAVTWSTLMAAHTRSNPAAAPVAAPAASRPVPTPPSRRVMAVQRALTDFGYGQLRLTGVIDEATKAAIEKFERQRKLPASGRISDRLLRELAAVTGRSFE